MVIILRKMLGWWKNADRPLLVGLAVSGFSLLFIGIALFAVVSALTSDPVQLPDEGSIQEILNGPGDGSSQPGSVPQPTPPIGPHPTRITISRIFVDAPIIALSVEPGTTTPAVPDQGDEVGWYDFSAPPGLNANAVFAGHVDWQTARGQPIPGAFYRLRELHIGDEVSVTLEDGSTLKYRVTGNVAVKWDDPNVGRAMGYANKDVLTLITCGGAWENIPSHENGGNYTHRIVVRAEREAAPAVAAP
jgi:LPXTG-site transpeptidase (sortase) family protein